MYKKKKTNTGNTESLDVRYILALIPKRTLKDEEKKCQVSVSYVTCHLSLTPTATATDTPPLFTVGWFAQTQTPQNFQIATSH